MTALEIDHRKAHLLHDAIAARLREKRRTLPRYTANPKGAAFIQRDIAELESLLEQVTVIAWTDES